MNENFGLQTTTWSLSARLTLTWSIRRERNDGVVFATQWNRSWTTTLRSFYRVPTWDAATACVALDSAKTLSVKTRNGKIDGRQTTTTNKFGFRVITRLSWPNERRRLGAACRRVITIENESASRSRGQLQLQPPSQPSPPPPPVIADKKKKNRGEKKRVSMNAAALVVRVAVLYYNRVIVTRFWVIR